MPQRIACCLFATLVATCVASAQCGLAWEAMPLTAGTVAAAVVHDDGSGPALFVSTYAGSTSAVHRWSGSAWTTIGSTSSRINALISFALKALVVYFVIVKPFTALMTRLAAAPAPAAPPPLSPEVKVLTEIRDLLKAR